MFQCIPPDPALRSGHRVERSTRGTAGGVSLRLALGLGLAFLVAQGRPATAQEAPSQPAPAGEPAMERLAFRSWGPDDGVGKVTGLAETADGFLWLASPEGLLRFDGHELRSFRPESRGLAADPIHDVASDPAGYLLVAAASGLYRYDGRRFRVVSRPGSGGRPWPARLLRQDREGTMWVAAPDSLLRLEPGSGTLLQGLPGVTVTAIYEDPFGHLWAGTDSGHLYRRLGNAFQPVNLPPGLEQTPVRSFLSLDDDLLLLGRDDGAWRLGGEFSLGGLPRRAVPISGLEGVAITACRAGTPGVWIGSRSGLFLHRPGDAPLPVVPSGNGAADPRPAEARQRLASGVRALLVSDGFPAAGNLFAGTERGLVQLYDPRVPAPLPAPYLATVHVDGQPAKIAREIGLEADVGTVRLGVAAPSFRPTTRIEFRYRVGDGDWQRADGDEIVLDDVRSGPRTVEVQAGRDGEWTPPRTLVTLVREPRLWQTVPFWGAVSAGVAALALAVFYLFFWGGGPPPLEPLEDDEDVVHLEDLDSDELRAGPQVVEEARRRVSGASDGDDDA